MLSHQPVAIQDSDSGPQEVVAPVGDTKNSENQHDKMKQEDEMPHMEESGIFESSVFVRLGQSLELSSSHQQIGQEKNHDTTSNGMAAEKASPNDTDDAVIISNHYSVENVSIISGDEAKEKDNDDGDDYDDSQLWTSDDHLTQNVSSRAEDVSVFHRFKTAVGGVYVNSTISSLVAHNNFFSFGIGKWLGWTGCLLVIFAMSVSMMMNHVVAPTSSSMLPSPKEDLQSFVALERDRNDMDKLEDLRTEGFQRYARSACVAAGTLEQAQKALFIQLSGIPEDVRKHTIERALIEGITHRSSMQDSSSQLGSHGRAHSYMAFWSTVYHPRGRHDFKYETCVLVAGMEIGVTEVIAGYKTEEKKVVVGSTPCECGYFYCAGTCPLFHKVIERTPIFQRHSLSLKQQDDLHRWLVKNAIDAAEGLVSGSNVPKLPNTNDDGGGIDKNNKNALSAQVEVLAWKKPPLLEAFSLDES